MAETVKQNWDICKAVVKVGKHTVFVNEYCKKKMEMCGHKVVQKSRCEFCMEPVRRRRKKKNDTKGTD